MRNLLFISALCVSLVVLADSEKTNSDNSTEKSTKQETVNKSKPVGYVIGIVKRGDNWEQDSIRAFELQEKHLAFLAELQKNNQLVASGPLTSSPDARGLYIFSVNTIKEAELLVSKDEAISVGWIKMEFHKWEARDYEVKSASETKEKKQGLFSGGLGMLMIVFSIVILILMIRTFRGKASI